MDKKMIYAVVVVVILVVAAVGVYAVVNDDNGSDHGTPAEMDNAALKVYGNINGARYLNSDDATLIQQLIDEGHTAEEYPLADANRDGILNSDDVAVVNAVVNGASTTLWHINYHDINGDGIMDEEVVSTKYPISSVIMTASTNMSITMFSLGIVDEVKGATYSSSLDDALFGDNYLDTDKVVRLGTSSTSITFEDGRVGSSDVIAQQGVTAVLTDWNRTYITNEADFENANIDVVRISAAAVDEETLTHSVMLIGLLFQKVDRAESYLDLCMEVLNYVDSSITQDSLPKVVVSSMTGYLSSAGSDYTQAVLRAGAEYGIPDVSFGGSTSLQIEDHPEVYQYDFSYIIHLRSGLDYGQTAESNAELVTTCTTPFSDWRYADSGQYIVSGMIPPVLRVAYAAYAMHSDSINLDAVNELHQRFVDQFYNGLDIDVSSMKFVITPEDMA